jgi:hypothetical protein
MLTTIMEYLMPAHLAKPAEQRFQLLLCCCNRGARKEQLPVVHWTLACRNILMTASEAHLQTAQVKDSSMVSQLLLGVEDRKLKNG